MPYQTQCIRELERGRIVRADLHAQVHAAHHRMQGRPAPAGGEASSAAQFQGVRGGVRNGQGVIAVQVELRCDRSGVAQVEELHLLQQTWRGKAHAYVDGRAFAQDQWRSARNGGALDVAIEQASFRIVPGAQSALGNHLDLDLAALHQFRGDQPEPVGLSPQ
jgi:hypothetical protein